MPTGVKLDARLKSGREAVRFMEPLAAMALDMPTAEHPNKMPFSGVLTLLDTPSDRAPNGAKGRRVIMKAEAAERAIPSLLGMAVNYTAEASGHDVTKKVGVITAASVKDGAVHIDHGVIWAADFPKESAKIQASKSDLGFSWEIADVYVEDINADPLVITDCSFTGAAILRKDKAAYSLTSLAASAEETEMPTTEEIVAALTPVLDAKLQPLTERMGKLEASSEKVEGTMAAASAMMGKVEPHAKRLEDAADKMEADGMGMGGAGMGMPHTKMLRHMAGSMRADAAMGRMPTTIGHMDDPSMGHIPGGYMGMRASAAPKLEDDPAFKALKDELGASKTLISDLQAAAAKTATPSERKTEAATRAAPTPEVSGFLSKHGKKLGEGETLSAAAADELLKDEPLSTRIRLKTGLHKAGLIDA